MSRRGRPETGPSRSTERAGLRGLGCRALVGGAAEAEDAREDRPEEASPIPKPVPLPKLLARSSATMIAITRFTIGIRKSRIHHHSRPMILRSTRRFQIGMIDFQPASPAFVNTIQ